MPKFGSLGKFFGKTVSESAAFAAGVAVAPALEPVVQDVKNKAWGEHTSKPLEAEAAAAIVAEDVAAQPWGEAEAAYTGISQGRFDRLVQEALNGPGVGQLLVAYRRGFITDAQFVHGLRKAKLENLWDAPLRELKSEILSPQAVALGVVRSVLRDPGLMVVDLDTSGGDVPAYTPSSIDTLAEAAASGIDEERLRVMVGSIGLPMSAQQAASALFRGIIQQPDYNRAILEGDTRPEWAGAILEQARQIPSVSDYINAEIRGWITTAERNAGIAKHGMTPADGDLLFSRTGRPATTHQVHIGFQRGGRNARFGDDERETFRNAVIESDIRPEWEPILWAQRYTYPSAFVLRALAQAGDLDYDDVHTILLYEGWEPTLAEKVARSWTEPKAGGADKHVTSAQTRLLTAIHKAYVGGVLDDAAALARVEQAGLSASAAQGVLSHWSQEKQLEAMTPPPTP